jgi:hypothetical protein
MTGHVQVDDGQVRHTVPVDQLTGHPGQKRPSSPGNRPVQRVLDDAQGKRIVVYSDNFLRFDG